MIYIINSYAFKLNTLKRIIINYVPYKLINIKFYTLSIYYVLITSYTSYTLIKLNNISGILYEKHRFILLFVDDTLCT